MNIRVIGCSGSSPAGVRGGEDESFHAEGTSSYLFRTANTTMLVDAGGSSWPGFRNSMRPLLPTSVDGIVITHSHPDHCDDLFYIAINGRYDPRFSQARGENLIPLHAAPGVYTARSNVDDLYPFVFNHVQIGTENEPINSIHRFSVGDFSITAARTYHDVPTYALLIEADGQRVVYTADTGAKWKPAELFDEADLVIGEATYVDLPPGYDYHLTGKQLGKLATTMKAKRLLVTHLWGEMPIEERRRVISDVEANYSGELMVAHSGMRLDMAALDVVDLPEAGQCLSGMFPVLRRAGQELIARRITRSAHE